MSEKLDLTLERDMFSSLAYQFDKNAAARQWKRLNPILSHASTRLENLKKATREQTPLPTFPKNCNSPITAQVVKGQFDDVLAEIDRHIASE